jgi:aminopeptidase N
MVMNCRRAGVLLPLVAALLSPLVVLAPADAAPVDGSTGIGDGYFPLDGNGGIDVASYSVHDRYRFGTGRLTGVTTIALTATEDLARFDLDLLLGVRRVTVAGQRATFGKPDQHELQITPATPIASGSDVVVKVWYAGHPGRFSYAGENNWLADTHEVVAMNQPHMAPWWFPSNDHPSDKALMDVAITVPRHQDVISNGRRVSRHVHGHLATTRWRAAEPMATYLAFFAAGHYAIRKGVAHGLPWLAAVNKRVGRQQRTGLLQLLAKAPDVVRRLATDLGPYPFSTTGGLVTALPVGFALENQTRPTYPAFSPGNESLIVHELAHQWFGDSVALQRWRGIWLNEGAATFMELRWAETHGGKAASTWLRERYDANPAGASFWNRQTGDPGPGHIFDGGLIYVRGAMTFQALRNRVGEHDFWRIVRRWLSTRAGGTGTTQEFVHLAERVSGEDLHTFFRAWLFTGAKPDDTPANGLG